MERGMNLNDPRLKRYLDSLEPKYRKMLEDMYKSQNPEQAREYLKKVIENKEENTEQGEGGV
jgi:hypothetical protein